MVMEPTWMLALAGFDATARCAPGVTKYVSVKKSKNKKQMGGCSNNPRDRLIRAKPQNNFREQWRIARKHFNALCRYWSSLTPEKSDMGFL